MNEDEMLEAQQTAIESIFLMGAHAVNSLHLSDQTGAEQLRKILSHFSVLAKDDVTGEDIIGMANELRAWLEAKRVDCIAQLGRAEA